DGPAVDAPAASCPTPGDCSSGNGSAPRGRGDHGNAVVDHQRCENTLSHDRARDSRRGGRGPVEGWRRRRMSPTWMALEDRRLLSTIVVNKPHRHARPGPDGPPSGDRPSEHGPGWRRRSAEPLERKAFRPVNAYIGPNAINPFTIPAPNP